MDARGNTGKPRVPASFLYVIALVAVVAGPVYAMLAGTLGVGIFIFAAGVVLLGVGTLVGGRDRAVGWVLIFVGALTAAFDVLRLLLVGPW